jgi:hypothetical protein
MNPCAVHITPSQYYPATYVLVFLVIFLLVFPPTTYTRSTSPPFVLLTEMEACDEFVQDCAASRPVRQEHGACTRNAVHGLCLVPMAMGRTVKSPYCARPPATLRLFVLIAFPGGWMSLTSRWSNKTSAPQGHCPPPLSHSLLQHMPTAQSGLDTEEVPSLRVTTGK